MYFVLYTFINIAYADEVASSAETGSIFSLH